MTEGPDMLLIHAGIAAGGFRSYGRGMDGSWVNHGLATIGAYLTREGVDCDYLDLRSLSSWRDLARRIGLRPPRVAGVSATTVDYGSALKTARLMKKTSPRTTVLLGGVHASVCAEECAREDCFDRVVIGEGERACLEAVRGGPGTRICRGDRVEDLDDLPFIDRRVFGDRETPIYRKLFPAPFATFIAARGCPYNCRFCQPAERIVFGRRMRSRSPEHLVEEIARCVKDMDLAAYLVHDDCILADASWAEGFAEQLDRRNLRLPFAMQSRADLVCRHAELLRRLAGCGLRMLLIGFESGSQKMLDFLGKGTTVAQNLEAARTCHRCRIGIWANYMFGIPGETREDVMQTVRMVRTIKPAVCSPSYFTPYPGSGLAAYCREHDLIRIARYEEYRRGPEGRKLRGVDYAFLRKAVRLSKDESFLAARFRAVRGRLQHAFRL